MGDGFAFLHEPMHPFYCDHVMSPAGPISFPQRAKTETILSPVHTVELQETGTKRRTSRN
jgi:hypothetical protein